MKFFFIFYILNQSQSLIQTVNVRSIEVLAGVRSALLSVVFNRACIKGVMFGKPCWMGVHGCRCTVYTTLSMARHAESC